MSAPELKKINHAELPKFGDSSIPHIKRTLLRPPGMETPDILGKYGLYQTNEVSRVIDQTTEISDGGKKLLTGLLKDGGVGMFGTETEFDLGIDYDSVYKSGYKNEVINPALKELAVKIEDRAANLQFSVDGVLAPESSGIKQAAILSSYLKNADCFSVKKNGHSSPFAVAVDSYTQGKTDVISIAQSLFDSMKVSGQQNLILSDDIIDSGVMTQAVALILQLAQEAGFNVHLVGIVTPIEKMYTHAGDSIREKLGDIPIFSSLKIEDIGYLSEKQAWIKVVGIDKAISCKLKDSRVKTE